MTQLLGTKAAIVWTDTADSNAERVHLLAVPLRSSVPAHSRWVGRAQSLDRTVVESITVGAGAHEFVGTVRFDDDPQSLLDLLKAGNAATTLTYIPNLADPGVTHACKLIAPVGLDEQLALDQARASFGNASIELRLRRTDQGPFLAQHQGTNVLWWFRGGGTLEGYTYSRATTATRIDKGRGQYAAVSSGQAATSWYDLDGDGIRETPALLMAPARTNLCQRSEDFANVWADIGTPTSGATKTCGSVTLTLLGDDSAAALEGKSQTISFTGNAAKAFSIIVSQDTSTSSAFRIFETTGSAERFLAVLTWSSGLPSVAMTTGTYLGYEALVNGCFRLYFQTAAITAASTNSLRIYPATGAALGAGSTGNLYVGGVQCEDALYPGPYIPTPASATVTRNQDVISLPFSARPQALSVYLRFIELGAVKNTATAERLLTIGANTQPFLALLVVGTGTYEMLHRNAASSDVVSAAAAAPVLGNVVELLGILNANGSVQLTQAINGVSATASASAAQTLPDAWGSSSLTIGVNTANATAAILNGCCVRGVQDLPTMRRIAKV